MKCRYTKGGDIKVTISNSECSQLNAVLDKYIDKAGRYPKLYPHRDFAKKLRAIPIQAPKA
jgi:hypothetical protein